MGCFNTKSLLRREGAYINGWKRRPLNIESPFITLYRCRWIARQILKGPRRDLDVVAGSEVKQCGEGNNNLLRPRFRQVQTGHTNADHLAVI